MRVVFPAPFGPRRQLIFPYCIVQLTLCSAVMSSNTLHAARTVMASVRFSVGSPDRGRGRRVASCLRCASVFAGSEPDPAISIFSRRSIGVRVQRMKQVEAGSASRTSRMTVSGGDAMRARGSASVM